MVEIFIPKTSKTKTGAISITSSREGKRRTGFFARIFQPSKYESRALMDDILPMRYIKIELLEFHNNLGQGDHPFEWVVIDQPVFMNPIISIGTFREYYV